MKKALEEVKRVIKENGGKFEVQENPRAIGAKNQYNWVVAIDEEDSDYSEEDDDSEEEKNDISDH